MSGNSYSESFEQCIHCGALMGNPEVTQANYELASGDVVIGGTVRTFECPGCGATLSYSEVDGNDE